MLYQLTHSDSVDPTPYVPVPSTPTWGDSESEGVSSSVPSSSHTPLWSPPSSPGEYYPPMWSPYATPPPSPVWDDQCFDVPFEHEGRVVTIPREHKTAFGECHPSIWATVAKEVDEAQWRGTFYKSEEKEPVKTYCVHTCVEWDFLKKTFSIFFQDSHMCLTATELLKPCGFCFFSEATLTPEVCFCGFLKNSLC